MSAHGPDRIELPNGWAPEGVTTMDGQLFVGSLADGAIWAADPETGEGAVLVEGADGMVAVGVEAEPANDRLWVAGGRTGEVRAYDAEDGSLLAVYPFESGFLNDVAATETAVFITDSFVPQLAVVPLDPSGSLDAPEAATTLPITGDFVYGDGFNANGIVAHPEGLIVAQSQPGALYRIDPDTGVSTAIDTEDVELDGADGLELDGDRLYVMRNQAGTIAALDLAADLSSATLVAELTSDDFDVPATVALFDDGLWAANARFGTAATPGTEYWLSRVPAPDDEIEG